MNEIEFTDQIDCNFPYNDRQEASRLIDLACQLSTNCAFLVAYELAFPPRGEFKRYRGKLSRYNQVVLLDLLTELEGKFEHPLKSMILTFCRKIIQGKPVAQDEVVEGLEILIGYPGQYNAAGIITKSCNCDDDSCWDQIDQRYHALVESWEIKN